MNKHFPCGHWHKRPTSPDKNLVAYFELLNGQVAWVDYQPGSDYDPYRLGFTTQTRINKNNFSGDSIVWEFEVIATNQSQTDLIVELVDDNLTSCASITLAAESHTQGDYRPPTPRMYRHRVVMTPTVVTDTGYYQVKITAVDPTKYIYPYGEDILITVARIVVTQYNATKSMLQIPLYHSTYNYEFCSTPNVANGEFQTFPGFPDLDPPYAWFCGIGSDVCNFCTADSLNDSTSSWKYDSNEVANVQKAVFSVLACGVTSGRGGGGPSQILATTNPIESIKYPIYWSTSAVSYAENDATPAGYVNEYTSHVGTSSGATFNPIPTALFSWDYGTDEYPFHYYINDIDFSGLPNSTCYLYLGGDLVTYIGGPWHHWAYFKKITYYAGYTLHGNLEVYSTDRSHFTFTLTYWYETATVPADFGVALWDLTTNAVVANSTLTWAFRDCWSRQYADVVLVSGHEYSVTFNYSYSMNPTQFNAPEIADAQLMLTVDPVSKYTSWQRVGMRWNSSSDNWYTPITWGDVFYPEYGYGGNNIFPVVAYNDLDFAQEVYFENSGYVTSQTVPEGYICIYLEDYASDISTGEHGVDVSGSLLVWTAADYEKVVRRRSGKLTLIKNHMYGTRTPGTDAVYSYLPGGFLVVRYIK